MVNFHWTKPVDKTVRWGCRMSHRKWNNMPKWAAALATRYTISFVTFCVSTR